MIHKKADQRSCKNYCNLTLFYTAYNTQGKTTTDTIHIINKTMENAYAYEIGIEPEVKYVYRFKAGLHHEFEKRKISVGEHTFDDVKK